MRKIFVLLIVMISSIFLLVGLYGFYENRNSFENGFLERDSEKNIEDTSLSWLKTEGNMIENEEGESIQLKGVSSHGIGWYSDLITYENLRMLKEEWNTNVFRIAMYSNPEEERVY